MSAATICAQAAHRAPPAAPTQLAFIDAPAEPPTLRLAVIGLLQRRPEVRLCSDGSVHLVVMLQQAEAAHGQALPFVAVQHIEAAGRLHVEQLAARLHIATAVLLRGEGLVLTHHAGELVLKLQHCDSVSEIAFDTHIGGSQP